MYVEGNPANYVDPSGQTSTFSQTAGCAAIISLQNYSFLEFDVSDTDMKGWTCDELAKAADEIGQLDKAVKSGLSKIFTWVIPVKRVNKDKWCAYYKINGTVDVQNPFNTTRCAPGTMGHELIHAWDHKQDISHKFAKYVGATSFLWFYDVGSETPPLYGGGDPPNAFEDFAESVTEYVYDQGIQERLPSTEKRWKFVQSLLDTGTILTSTEIGDMTCNTTPLLISELLWN